MKRIKDMNDNEINSIIAIIVDQIILIFYRKSGSRKIIQ